MPLNTASRRLHACLLAVMGLCICAQALGCSILVPKYAGFDPKEYVFYGELTGYVSTRGPDCDDAAGKPCGSWGWKLKVLEPVLLPRQELKEVEVYTLRLDAMCGRTGYPRKTVEQTPIGSRFAIVAKESGDVAPNSGSHRVFLDGNDYVGAILMPLPQGADVAKLRQQEFDYRFQFLTSGGRHRAAFELRKDMARLEMDSSSAARERVLARLATALLPMEGGSEPDPYRSLVSRYIGDEAIRKKLLALRLEGLYQTGIFRGKSEMETVFHDLDRAKAGSAEYQFYYGLYELYSVPERAIPWFKKASRQGFVAADLMLGRSYEKLAATQQGAGKAKSLSRAQAAYRRAALRGQESAARGDTYAQLMLATQSELRPWLSPRSEVAQRAEQCALVTKVPIRYWWWSEAKCEEPQ